MRLGHKRKFVLYSVSALVAGILLFFALLKTGEYKQFFSVGDAANFIDARVPNDLPKTPKHLYFTKNPELKPKVSARAYLVGDLDTGEIIIEQNDREKFPIASVSKLMTALVAKDLSVEKSGEEAVLQLSKNAVATYGKNGNFTIGEKIKFSEIFYPLLLESSNDAAEALAEFFGRDKFIERMNVEAKTLELFDTSFEDPSGLSANNKSTARDLFKLAGFINQKKQDLLTITKEKSYSNKKHNWSSNNQFLHEEGYLGGKSGFTDPAKESVVSLFSLPLGDSSNRNIGITLLRSEDRYKDVSNILKFLKSNVYYGAPSDGQIAQKVEVTEEIKPKTEIPPLPPPPPPLPEVKDPDFVTLSFLGDIMLDRGVRNSVLKNFGGNYGALFENLSDLKKSDAVFANLEGTASDLGKDLGNLYSFRMDPSVVPALSGAGINILSVANNHIGDWGRDAYEDTLARLRENEILYTGGGQNLEEATEPTTMQYYGVRIGFLGFADNGPGFMEARTDRSGFLSASNPRFDEIIQNAAEKVDYLIVSFHFGEEYEKIHNARQEYLAHRAIDDGAKIVVGHHPHVIEDTEAYSPKDCTQSSCMGYIAYSLGNFIFDQKFSSDTMEGLWLEIKLEKDGDMIVNKNIVKLNNIFQPDRVEKGKEEKIEFTEINI